VLDARMVPTMLLDATLPSELILQKFYPQVDVVSDVQVEMPHVRVRQVLGAPVSQNKLWGTDKEPSKGNNLHGIRRYILQRWLEIDGPRLWAEECQRQPDPERRREPMVVICQKEVRLWLQNAPSERPGERYEEVLRPGVTLPEGIALEHFNAIAGLDDHKGVRLLMTIGRTLPPPAAVEAISGALTGKQPAVVKVPTGRGYDRVSRGIRMADGSGGIEVMNHQHVDEIAEAVRFQICEAELVQSIGRGRGVNRTAETPLDVDIVSDVVVPITVNEVVHWETPSETVEMPARDAIALTVQGDMAKAWPSVWKNAEAARYALRKLGVAKVRPGGVPIDQVVKSLSRILKGKFPLDATFIYRRAANKVHFAVAFFDPRELPNPGPWLKEKCGELAERLHFLWQPHEIPPVAGTSKLTINDSLIWTLVRETLDQLFDRAAKNPWRKLPENWPTSQFVCEPCDPEAPPAPHVCPAGQLGRMIYKPVAQRKAEGTYCVWPRPAEREPNRKRSTHMTTDGISIDGLPRPPKVGPCDQCGRMTDAYVGHDCWDEFLCDTCTDEVMGEGWAQDARAKEERRKKH
jgi:hypothetical protein